MEIINLGAIKKATIPLHRTMIFWGNNNVGKTTVLYAIYSLYCWLTKKHHPNEAGATVDIISEKEIQKAIDGQDQRLNYERIKRQVTDEVVSEFNKLDGRYFSSFFKDNVYTPKSKIKIDKKDIEYFYRDTRDGNWYVRNNTLENSVEYRLTTRYVKEDDEESIHLHFGKYNVEDDKEQTLPHDERKKIDPKEYLYWANDNIIRLIFNSVGVYHPAERVGINEVIKLLQRKSGMSNQDEDNKEVNDYIIKPISDYIDFVDRNRPLLNKKYSLQNYGEDLQKLIPGSFNYDSNQNEIYFTPSDESNMRIGFSMLSSSLKALLSLNIMFAISDGNKYSNYIFMDEPEMNLSPASQISMATLLYECQKMGYRIILSTHSDYFIKKMMNLTIKEKKNTDPSDIVGFCIEDDHSCSIIESLFLEKNQYINVFDNPSRDINDEYFKLTGN